MLTGTRLYTQAQAEIHAAYQRDGLDQYEMDELARNAGRRLDWAEKTWREMSDAEKVAFANYRISLNK